MQQETLAAWVCTALMRIGTRMATGFDQHVAAAGITQAQFRILLAVWSQGEKEGIAPSALADHLFIERGTVSVLTKRMVEQGWLVRLPGENRRTHRLALTARGGKMLRRSVPDALALADQTLSGFTERQLRQMRRSLELIELRLRARGQQEE